MSRHARATAFAFLAAALYAINSPVSKLLLDRVSRLRGAAYRELPSAAYLIALGVMLVGTYFASSDQA